MVFRMILNKVISTAASKGKLFGEGVQYEMDENFIHIPSRSWNILGDVVVKTWYTIPRFNSKVK